MITLLDLHRWNAGMSDKNENWLFTIHFTAFPSISLCCARMSRYRHPSSFSFRIKRPCAHRKSQFHPLEIGYTAQNMYPAIKYTQKQRFDIYFHSQPCILLITSHFDVLFIIIMCDERQNVVIKSNILTMLKDLKPRTIFISTLVTLISFIIWRFVERLINFDVVRAKKQ